MMRDSPTGSFRERPLPYIEHSSATGLVIFGPPNEIIGRHFSTFYPAADVEADNPAMELRVATETGRFEEKGWRVRKDGSRFWANVIITRCGTSITETLVLDTELEGHGEAIRITELHAAAGARSRHRSRPTARV
jgi:hypothetical protein